jgi:hypothetical protein
MVYALAAIVYDLTAIDSWRVQETVTIASFFH